MHSRCHSTRHTRGGVLLTNAGLCFTKHQSCRKVTRTHTSQKQHKEEEEESCLQQTCCCCHATLHACRTRPTLNSAAAATNSKTICTRYSHAKISALPLIRLQLRSAGGAPHLLHNDLQVVSARCPTRRGHIHQAPYAHVSASASTAP